MKPLRRLSLRGRLNPVQTTNCQVWRTTGITGSGDSIGLYVKLAEPLQLFADIVCARIARACKLPVPEPFLVAATREQMGNPRPWPWQDQQGLLFGVSALHRAEKFSRFLTSRGLQAAPTLRNWKGYWAAGWFDEWIGNVDRNLGNILVVSDDDYRLIDHDQAFGGTEAWLFGLDSRQAHDNILLDTGHLDGDKYYAEAGRKSFHIWVVEFAQAAVSRAFDGVPFLSKNEHQLVADYLSARLTCMPELLCQRLKLPQKPLPLTSAASQQQPSTPGTPGASS